MRTSTRLTIVVLVACGCSSTQPERQDATPPSAPPIAQELLNAARESPADTAPDPRSSSRVLAYVEGDVVTYREVLQRAGPELVQFADNPEEKAKVEERALTGLLRERMLYHAAVDLGVRANRDEIADEREAYVKELAKNGGSLEGFLHDRDMTRREFDEMIRVELVIQKYRRAAIGRNNDPDVHVRPDADVYVSPDDVSKYYERHPERYREPAGARCRMLAVKADLDAKDREAAVAAAKAKAEATLARLRAGEDWVPVYREVAGVAAEVDTSDGLLEMRRGEKAEWIESFAFKSEKGALSEVIQKGATFYVLRAEGWHEARTTPFAEAAPNIRQHLFQASSERAWFEVQLSVLDRSSIQPESRRARLREDLRAEIQKLNADAGQ